mmetsp:Transcript_91726/g.268484  ORF Transcript_91726/g.268484 Transcript_91726/m.268484 type:complete len:239 (+) Transcript_91726:207-923(+)
MRLQPFCLCGRRAALHLWLEQVRPAWLGCPQGGESHRSGAGARDLGGRGRASPSGTTGCIGRLPLRGHHRGRGALDLGVGRHLLVRRGRPGPRQPHLSHGANSGAELRGGGRGGEAGGLRVAAHAGAHERGPALLRGQGGLRQAGQGGHAGRAGVRGDRVLLPEQRLGAQPPRAHANCQGRRWPELFGGHVLPGRAVGLGPKRLRPVGPGGGGNGRHVLCRALPPACAQLAGGGPPNH